MTSPLTRRQSVLLGLVVLAAVGLLAYGLVLVGGKQGVFADRVEVSVRLKEAHDIAPGTAVRVRGVDAGSVSAVEYPEYDGPTAAVVVRMMIDRKYADRLYADATAQAFAPTPLGSKVIAIDPGTPKAGPLPDGELAAKETPDLGTVVAKLDATADEAQNLLKDVRSGKGSLGKLATDDTLYQDLSALAKDSRTLVKRADGAVQTVEDKAAEVDKLTADARGAIKSVKQGTDAIQSLPVIRNYVVDADRLLDRPDCKPVVFGYNVTDLFETGTAILTDDGRGHLTRMGDGLRKVVAKGDVVVAAVHDPADRGLTDKQVGELTRKRAEVVLEFLKSHKGLKTSWFSSRKATAVGLGTTPSPLSTAESSAPSYVQVVVFVPQ
jgi:phospholipid/cholesterol/gamma-HCH transport system substrate-binding protein